VAQDNFCIDSVLKHCAANRKRRLSALPNIGLYIYMTLKFLALQGAPYIYDISRLRVKQDKHCTFMRNIEVRWHNHCCRRRPISITYFECVFIALIMQRVKLMCCIMLSSLANLAIPDFSTLFHKRHDFREN
jgi:hypothetical protein